MSSRISWPKGLKAIFWITVLGCFLGARQLFVLFADAWKADGFTIFVTVFSLVDYGLIVSAALAGFLGRRGAFSILVLVECALSGAVLVWINFQTVRLMFPSVLARPFSLSSYDDLTERYFIWNCIQLGVNLLISFYIAFYEFRWFRSGSLNA